MKIRTLFWVAAAILLLSDAAATAAEPTVASDCRSSLVNGKTQIVCDSILNSSSRPPNREEIVYEKASGPLPLRIDRNFCGPGYRSGVDGCEPAGR